MKIRKIFILFTIAFFVSFCKTNNSIISINDTRYFKETPKIVNRDDRYFVRWIYSEESTIPLFYMLTKSEIINDTLQIYIPVTTSSGNLKGKYQFDEITSSIKINKIKENKVVWREPNNSHINLQVEEMSINDARILMKIWKGYNSKEPF